jgi:hypothetical protein
VLSGCRTQSLSDSQKVGERLSSILDRIRDLRRARIIVGQVSFSFVLAGFNWAVVTAWISQDFPKFFQGTWVLDGAFWGGLLLIFAWPIVLSIVGSLTYPEQVLISPLDINGLTIGIFSVTLWVTINPLNYVDTFGQQQPMLGLVLYGFSLFMTAFVMLIFGVLQNPIAARFVGIGGSEKDLAKAMYYSSMSQYNAADNIWAKRKILSLDYEDQLEDGTTCFAGFPDGIELHIAVSKDEDKSRVTLIAFEKDALGMKQPDPLWFKGKIASILIVLEELHLTALGDVAVSRHIMDHALTPTRGLLTRFRETWSGIVRHIIAAIVLGAADYWLWLNKIIGQDIAIQLGFFVALYVVGASVLSRRKRLKV